MRRIFIFSLIAFIFIFGIVSAGIASEEESYLNSLAKKQGVVDVDNIIKLNSSVLPEYIEVGDIKDNNVGIYNLKYNDSGKERDLFVLTYSSFKMPSEPAGFYDSWQYSFGFGKGDVLESKYIVLDDGYITGLASVANMSGGEARVYIYKNGIALNFFNELSGSGILMDYDFQSSGLISVNKGDLLEFYVDVNGGVLNEIYSTVKFEK